MTDLSSSSVSSSSSVGNAGLLAGNSNSIVGGDGGSAGVHKISPYAKDDVSYTNAPSLAFTASTNGAFHFPSGFIFTHENYGPQVNFTIWFLTALAAMFLSLRVYCKFLRHRGLWWDDHVLIAAFLSLVASSSFISVSITLGFGRPFWDFNFHDLTWFLLWTNLAGTFSILAALWSKTSFAITVLRISSGWTRWLVWFILITVNIALGLAVAFTWCQCTPVQKTWRPGLDGTCWPKSTVIRYNMFTAVYSGAMDIILAFVPWKIIWPLTMNKKEKIGVLVAMSMGVFAGITSIVKTTQLPTIGFANLTESTTQLVILGTAEGAITIMAASIPILRALLRDVRLPPAPAQFYHQMDSNMYAGTANTRGTGRNSTVITSSGNHRGGGVGMNLNVNLTGTGTMSSRWSKLYDVESIAGATAEPGGGGYGHAASNSGGGTFSFLAPLKRISRFSRLSGLSFGMISVSHSGTGTGTSASNAKAVALEMEPPPGKIVQTEEVVVEYEPNQFINIGRAI